MHTTIALTGASRGLGLALAQQLTTVFDGEATVLLTARGPGDASAAAEALKAEGISVEAYTPPLDVADAASIDRFARFIDVKLGGVDLLVNNAAICEPGWDEETVRRTLRTNVLGPASLARRALQGMMRRRRGHVLHITSGDGELLYLQPNLQSELARATSRLAVLRTLARAAPPYNRFGHAPAHGPTPAYSLSKAALNAITRIDASQLPPPATCGVRISAVCPGDVLTRMCVDQQVRREAVTAEEAAIDVAWLAAAGLDASYNLPSGRFWRGRQHIDF